MNKKDLKYYLGLEYDLIIKKVIEDKESFYKVTTNELDDLVFYGVGDTIDEAIESFQEAKDTMIPFYLENGYDIPEPNKPDKDELLPSGKFVLRISPRLHKQLLILSKKENKSLNSYIENVLITFVTASSISKSFIEMVEDKIECFMNKCETSFNYRIGNLYNEHSFEWNESKFKKVG